MQAEELLEENADFAQAWVRLDVLLEQVTARHSQVRLCNGSWRSECIFWSVKPAIGALTAEVRGQVAQDSQTKAQTVGVWLHHTRLLKGRIGAVSRIRLAIVECDVDRQPVRLSTLVIINLILLVLFLVLIGLVYLCQLFGLSCCLAFLFLFLLCSIPLFSIFCIFFLLLLFLFQLFLLLLLLFHQLSYLSQVNLSLDDGD